MADSTTNDRSPAQLFALVVGATLVLAGILGFFYSSAFGTPGETDAVLGILDVNGWHNVVHLASGAVGLAMMGRRDTARTYALGFGIVYALVTVWGFIIGDGESILGFIPVNTADNFLHLILTLTAFGAYAASAPARDRTRAATA